jgi:hypothetical protein
VTNPDDDIGPDPGMPNVELSRLGQGTKQVPSCKPGAPGWTQNANDKKEQCDRASQKQAAKVLAQFEVKSMYVEDSCPFWCNQECCDIEGLHYLQECELCSAAAKCHQGAKGWKPSDRFRDCPKHHMPPTPQPIAKNCPDFCDQYCCAIDGDYFFHQCYYCNDNIECSPGTSGKQS